MDFLANLVWNSPYIQLAAALFSSSVRLHHFVARAQDREGSCKKAQTHTFIYIVEKPVCIYVSCRER